jgi:FlgD Ig-like domain
MRLASFFWAAAILLISSPAAAQDPTRTATIYVDGFDPDGATLTGTFGADRDNPMIDSVATFARLPVARGTETLSPDVIATCSYYGDTPPASYTAADRAQLDQVTTQWGGGVPRYALIVAKYARNVLARSGAQKINLVSASFGSLIVRWLIEKDVEGLASEGRIARWLSIEGVIAGNWAASRDDLVPYLDFLHPLPIDVDHMSDDWVATQIHTPRTEADTPLYAGILIGEMVSSDDGYNNGALSALMRTYDEWQPNDGVQAVADAGFGSVTARSRFAGLPPTRSVFHDDHLGVKEDRAAWAQAVTFIQQRRRVTVTMTSARVTDLHEAHDWYWDWRPAEVVLESRVYSPALEAKWGIRAPICATEKEGAVAPLRRYSANGETQSFTHVVFDDLVSAEETGLRLALHAEEIDYDWRYGVYETAQTPYYDELGSGTLMVSTLSPGNYTFQSGSWSCTIAVTLHDYPFAAPVGVAEGTSTSGAPALRVTPNPQTGAARVRVEGVAPAPATLDVFDVVGRRVRRMIGDALAGFSWDGRDDAGARLNAGIYMLRVTTAAGTWSGKSLLLR